jgi:hypothetical protein
MRSSTVNRLQQCSVSAVLFSLVDQVSEGGILSAAISEEEKLIHALQVSAVEQDLETRTVAYLMMTIKAIQTKLKTST